MSTKGWRKNTSITRQLIENPGEFQFLQAVRLLERSAVFEKTTSQSVINDKPVARFVPPSGEIVRFKTNQSLAFHSSEIQHVKRENKSAGHDQWLMILNIMGLTGSMGVLPYHYTELILKRQKLKDDTLEHFFDLFNHRTLSLFFQASAKYNLPLQYERNRLLIDRKKIHDNQTQALLSIIGMGTDGLTDRLYTRDESLLRYSGLFSQRVKSASNLKQILRSHFSIPVEIEQFVGQWEDLVDDVRTRLPDINHPTGCNSCLGKSAMLGKKGWFAQGKIRIILGPLSAHQLNKFGPGTRAFKAINELVRFFVDMEINYQFIIRINRKDIPEKIQLRKKHPPVLGWNCWLSNKPLSSSSLDQMVDISVSASRLN